MQKSQREAEERLIWRDAVEKKYMAVNMQKIDYMMINDSRG